MSVPSSGSSDMTLGVSSLLRLLQLSCPTLPIGAYAYSQGLENAVENGWVSGEDTAFDWIGGLLAESVARLDLPFLLRAYDAWLSNDTAHVRALCQRLLACRECRELQEEEAHLGTSLARVLTALGVQRAEPWTSDEDTTFVALFALGGVHYSIPRPATASAYCFAWSEHQVSAATRLIPLGQMSAQRILSRLLSHVPDALCLASSLGDDEVGYFAPGQSMASALHETQRVRLFRS